MSLAVFIVVAACALKLCASTLLECLNLKSLRDHAGAVPEAFSSFMDAQTYAKSGEYTRQKTKFCIAEDSFSFVFLTALLVSGAFPYMYGKGIEMLASGVWGQALTLVGIFAVISIPSLPFEFFEQFFSFRDGVAHSVHLAGFAFAWLYFVVRFGINPLKVWKNAYR